MLVIKEISMDLDLLFLPLKIVLGFWGIAPERTDTSRGGVVARQLRHSNLLLHDGFKRWLALVSTVPGL